MRRHADVDAKGRSQRGRDHGESAAVQASTGAAHQITEMASLAHWRVNKSEAKRPLKAVVVQAEAIPEWQVMVGPGPRSGQIFPHGHRHNSAILDVRVADGICLRAQAYANRADE